MPLLTRVKKFNFISPRDLTSRKISYPKSNDALPLRVLSYVKPLTLYPPEESKAWLFPVPKFKACYHSAYRSRRGRDSSLLTSSPKPGMTTSGLLWKFKRRGSSEHLSNVATSSFGKSSPEPPWPTTPLEKRVTGLCRGASSGAERVFAYTIKFSFYVINNFYSTTITTNLQRRTK